MQVKTSELSGIALDWAVARVEGRLEPSVVNNFCVAWYSWRNTHYSSEWAFGGPIIEREIKNGLHLYGGSYAVASYYCETLGGFSREYYGETALIAAMRCYVASKLGEVVEVPDELVLN